MVVISACSTATDKMRRMSPETWLSYAGDETDDEDRVVCPSGGGEAAAFDGRIGDEQRAWYTRIVGEW